MINSRIEYNMNCLNNETNVKIKFVRIGIEQSDRNTIITSRTSLK